MVYIVKKTVCDNDYLYINKCIYDKATKRSRVKVLKYLCRKDELSKKKINKILKKWDNDEVSKEEMKELLEKWRNKG